MQKLEDHLLFLYQKLIKSRFDVIVNHYHLASLGLIVIAELPVVAGLVAQ